MGKSDTTLIELKEFEPTNLPQSAISIANGTLLWQKYGDQVKVEFPSPKTDGMWRLVPQGWVGYIPLAKGLGISLKPKVALGNVFRMLEYAYRLRNFRFLDGLLECNSLLEFYEYLANVLARRVLDKARRGFFRDYHGSTDNLSVLRGRLLVREMLRKSWETTLPCDFEEFTEDIADNQILTWTLARISHSGMCTDRSWPTVRSSYNVMQGVASELPFRPIDCTNRTYNRLNEDYHPLHALCRFFLEQRGPTHASGNRIIMPFLVDMAHLFELFVAEWLRAHLREPFTLKAQERIEIGGQDHLHFSIDLALFDSRNEVATRVLDTKYKLSPRPSASDIAQVVAYAKAKGCREALLVYPFEVGEGLDVRIGTADPIRVRAVGFRLDEDIEASGNRFLAQAIA